MFKKSKKPELDTKVLKPLPDIVFGTAWQYGDKVFQRKDDAVMAKLTEFIRVHKKPEENHSWGLSGSHIHYIPTDVIDIIVKHPKEVSAILALL